MKKIKLLLAAAAAMVTMGVQAQGWTAQAPADGDYFLYNVGAGKYLSCGSEYWGTKACIDNGALNFTLANNGSGAYTLYTTSTFSYGNPNVAQLQSSGYVDQNVSATTWTFGPVDGMDNTYTLLNAAGTYLVAPSDGTKSILLNEEAPTTNYGYWKLINRANLFPETATVENPTDITCLIGDANFESSNNTMEGFWTIVASNNNLAKGNGGSDTPNNAVESWQSAFTLSQTITVPNGNYRLRAQGWIREYTVTGADYPVVYIASGTSEKTSPFIKMKTETASLGTVEGYFVNGDGGEYFFTDWTETIKVTNGSITIGARGTRTNSWNVYDNFQLQYVGPIDLTEYKTALADAVSAAEATEGTIPTAAYNAISAVVTANNKTYDNEDDYTTAIIAINNAVSTYASSAIVAAYSNYQAVRTAVLAVEGSLDVSAADALANDGTDANLDDALASARGTLKSYISTTDKTNVDLTAALLVNPSFEDGFTGWTNTGMVTQTNASFAKDGNYYCEHWQPNGTFGVSQVLTGMPSGVYCLTVDAKTRGVSSGKVFAGGIEVATKIADQVNNYAVEFACDDNADITFGFEGTGTGAGNSWLALDNFRLTLVSAGLPDVEAITGKMNADVAAAQASAIEAYEAGKTIAGYNAALAAIAAAQASVEAYAKLVPVFTKIDAALTAATTATESTDAYDAIKTAYNNGTIADNDIHNQIVAAYAAVIPVIKSQTAASADFTFAIQNPSFEFGDLTGWTVASSSDTGVRELSNNTYATDNADGDYIFNTWWQGVPLTQTVAGLPNGQYTLTVTVASDEGATIYLLGNGEHNSGTETTVKTTGIDATFTFLVKQGSATIGVVGSAEDGSYVEAGHWWYKADNFRLVKNRELTAEEAFVPATNEDYALLNGNLAKYVLGFEAGEFAPYNNATLVQAIAAAKAIDQDAENAQEDVQAAAEAITSAGAVANLTEVNGFYDGFFTIQTVPASNTKPLGWNRNSATAKSTGYEDTGYQTRIVSIPTGVTASNVGMMTKQHAFYGDQESYTLPLKANTYYIMTFKYAGYNDQPTIHINVYSEDGTKVDGSSSVKTKDNKGHQQASGWADFTYIFKTADAGNYVIGIIKDSGATEQKQVVVTDLNLVKAPTVDVTMSITSAKYATFIAPFDVEIPVGVAAYGVQSADEDDVLTLDDVETTIPANTPVILKSESVVDEVFSGQNIATKDSYTAGWLTGVYTTDVAPDGSYILQKHDGEDAGFYLVDYAYLSEKSMEKPNVPANRAYLTVPSGGGVKAFFLNGGDTDAIKSVFSGIAEGKIFDLSGRKVAKMQKGNTYIVNGKKVNVK